VVAVSDADQDSLPAQLADRAVRIGPASAGASYLRQDVLLAAASGTGCDAIHPGYGFLSENPVFAAACEDAGIAFVGPPARVVKAMGNKLEARAIAERHGVPVAPGSPSVGSVDDAAVIVDRIGYPVLFKAAAGGGGRGIRIVAAPDQLAETFRSASAEAEASFGDGTLYVECHIRDARHIEVQVFGDQHGAVLHLGERDCSLQRRYQKIVEEAPAFGTPQDVLSAIRTSAVELARGIGYENAGTVEFIYDQERREFYFLEMNTRIQVEHPVTEEVTGLDLVETQLRVAAGEPLGIDQHQVRIEGHAIECRITAESAADNFRPSPGLITGWRTPGGPGVRLDTHCYPGYRVPAYYDSLLAKLVTWGADRAQAIARMRGALAEFQVDGVQTTIPFLAELMADPDYVGGRVNTTWVENRPGSPGV
ncbi:MAG: acetyl-CoA carboxylase biotin carboxylase subunit, partial [Micromonosporaceae bacterium]